MTQYTIGPKRGVKRTREKQYMIAQSQSSVRSYRYYNKKTGGPKVKRIKRTREQQKTHLRLLDNKRQKKSREKKRLAKQISVEEEEEEEEEEVVVEEEEEGEEDEHEEAEVFESAVVDSFLEYEAVNDPLDD